MFSGSTKNAYRMSRWQSWGSATQHPPFAGSGSHLLQPPDLLLFLLQAEPSLFMLHLQLLPPLGHLPHMLKHKTVGEGQSFPTPPFPQQTEDRGASATACSLLKQKSKLEAAEAGSP